MWALPAAGEVDDCAVEIVAEPNPEVRAIGVVVHGACEEEAGFIWKTQGRGRSGIRVTGTGTY